PEREELHVKTFAAGPFLQDLLARIRPRLEGIRLVRDIDEGLCLTTDPEVLFKILENVVVNAAEAVDDDGVITVTARSDGNAPFFMVQDNGVGMTDDFIRNRLFKPFQTTKKKGTGLGMWQVKNMADQIGARIEVKGNEARGVSVSLWLQRPAPQEPGAKTR
ncbi:MAG TPA: ATP-binding protein, partial [Deltaproteobacteria bacterium]|nr:ATP-binding protein [Deltaproteobacteria bacterium]